MFFTVFQPLHSRFSRQGRKVSTVWPLSPASRPGWSGRQLQGHQQARTARRWLGRRVLLGTPDPLYPPALPVRRQLPVTQQCWFKGVIKVPIHKSFYNFRRHCSKGKDICSSFVPPLSWSHSTFQTATSVSCNRTCRNWFGSFPCIVVFLSPSHI